MTTQMIIRIDDEVKSRLNKLARLEGNKSVAKKSGMKVVIDTEFFRRQPGICSKFGQK